MSQTLALSEDLYERLRRAADQQSLSIEQLLAQWITALAPASESVSAPTSDDELLLTCTRALLDGSKPPIAIDWNEIQAALQNSEPLYPSVEEAMSALRSRPWAKDE